jgi:hypothetical protein
MKEGSISFAGGKMELPNDWLIYLIIGGIAALFFVFYAVGRKGLALFFRLTVQDGDRQRILEKLRLHYQFFEKRELREIRIVSVDFPSECCGGAVLQVEPIFAEQEKTPPAENLVRICRTCLKHETIPRVRL